MSKCACNDCRRFFAIVKGKNADREIVESAAPSEIVLKKNYKQACLLCRQGNKPFRFVNDECTFAICSHCQPDGIAWLDLAACLAGLTSCEFSRRNLQGQAPEPMAQLASRAKRSTEPGNPKPLTPPPGKGAADIWARSVPITGTPAQSYLERRKLDPSIFSPDAVRFCDAYPYGKFGSFQAMVTPLTFHKRELVSLQGTLLAKRNQPADKYGRVAGLNTNKPQLPSECRMFDTSRGAGIWVRRIAGSRWLIIAEGFETAATMAMCIPSASVVASASTSGLPTIDVGSAANWDLVMIAADADQKFDEHLCQHVDGPGIAAAKRARAIFESQGLPVLSVCPSLDYLHDWQPEEGPRPKGVDWADVLRWTGIANTMLDIEETIETERKKRGSP